MQLQNLLVPFQKKNIEVCGILGGGANCVWLQSNVFI